ncbi:MAG: DUF3791 domain-containing protein [Clostridiales Family XIII bacterium]|nr:DUF3791 domain-containing protein [Clostridiales Family XIII bacterium]
MKLNQVAHLQTEVAHAYMREHILKPTDFVDLDRKYGILRFIENGYELFHLTGTQGILNEIDDYICIQREHSEIQHSHFRP